MATVHALRPAPAANYDYAPSGAWWRVLVTGFGLFVLGVVVLLLTGNINLFPTVVLLGNFLVPVAYVAFFYQRRHMATLNLPSVSLAFFYGGVLGAFAAALLEPIFIRRLNPATALEVGFIEEFAKILGVLVVARRRRHDTEIDGLILGAAAGMGFAALESTGYAFSAFLSSGGSLSATVAVTLFRGALAPLGHGTWTAALASVLFRESGRAHFHFNRKVLGAYLAVSLLHGLWDGLPDVVAVLASSGWAVLGTQAAIALASLALLWWRWREAKHHRDQEVAGAELAAWTAPETAPEMEQRAA